MANPASLRHGPLGTTRAGFLTGFILLAAVAAAAPQAAWGIDDGTLGIRPSNESDFFNLAVLPGEQLDAVAIVSNHTTEPITLLTYPVDGQTTPEGAFALETQDDSRDQVGAWAALSTTQIVVPAESDVEVPFRVSVPVGTAPGDYAGGLIIQSPPVEGETTDESGTAMRIDVVQRQGVRVYLTVPGEVVTTLDIGDLDGSHTGDEVAFTLPVTNSGNTTLFPTASVMIDRWFAGQTTLDFIAPESVPPGETVNLTASLAVTDSIQIGSAHATVTSAAGTETASTTFFSVPWPLLVGAALATLAVAFGVWRAAIFIRKARRALAAVARTENTTATANVPSVESPGTSSSAAPELPAPRD